MGTMAWQANVWRFSMKKSIALSYIAAYLSLIFSMPAVSAEQKNLYGLDDPCKTNDCIMPAQPGPVCDWNPTEKIMPYIGCGFMDTGMPNPGKFDCGQASNGKNCEEKCIFKECAGGP